MDTVEIVDSTMVAPCEATPKERQWLSSFDVLMLPRIYTSVIFLYRNNGDPEFFSVTKIKTALAKALVPFYPFAGRLSEDKDGRPEIECNGEGALFVVARSKLTLDQLRNYVPSPENRNLFVPVVNSGTPPLLMLQVTFLESGDAVLGVAFDHSISDVHGDFHFMQSLTSMARGNTSTVPPPFLDRTLLRARSPPFCSSNHPENILAQYRKSLNHNAAYPPFVSTILKLSKEQIGYLKNRPGHGSTSGTVTTFQAVSAHIWKCVCLARDLSQDRDSHLLFPVGIRSRVSPPLPKYFFGNSTTPLGLVSARVSEVIGFIPERIREVVARIDDAYVRECIDYLETTDKNSLLKRYKLTAYDMFVTSWLGIPCYDTDFGYGEPIFVTRAETIGGIAFLMNNPSKDQGISVLIGLEVATMERFKTIFYDLD